MSLKPISLLSSTPDNHEFRRSKPSDSRSPCPALNTLANHGYITRNGLDLTFFELVWAIIFVYNLSYPLAILLASAGFLVSGKLSFQKAFTVKPLQVLEGKRFWTTRFINLILTLLNPLFALIPSLTLDLGSLSKRGPYKIAHDASFVHPNGIPSSAPDPNMLKGLLEYSSRVRDYQGMLRFGIGLLDIARFHAERVKSSPTPLDNLHTQVALGECALTWELLRDHPCPHGPGSQGYGAYLERKRLDAIVPTSRLAQWFGEERLPDGWWDVCGVRPTHSIGIWRARELADLIGKLAKKHVVM